MFERSRFTRFTRFSQFNARCAYVFVVTLVCTQNAGRARAHDESANNAWHSGAESAKQLVETAHALMATQHYAAACSKLEASQALAPQVSTQFQLASCYERVGRTASAFSQFRQLLSMTGADDVQNVEQHRLAEQHVQALEPRLSYLIIDTLKGQPISVRRDGIPVPTATLGSALPLDPGPHVIEASGAGKRSWSTRVTLAAVADRVSVAIPVLQNEDPQSILPSAAELAGPPLSAAQADSQYTRGSAQRTLAIVVAAVGVSGIATGGVFGLKAAANWSAAKASCHPYPYCGDAGPRLSSDAAQSGTVSTLAFLAGGVGLVSGALLWFTAAAPNPEARTALQVGAGAVRLRGRF